MTDQTEKTKSQRAAEAGQKFLIQENFKVLSPYISENVGRMLLARKGVLDGEEHFFGGRLHDDIRDLIQHSEWHTKNVLRVALFALVSEQVWSLRPNYFANLHKTFFGFPIKNPFAEGYLAWNHIEQNDSLGETGLGALEGLKAISSLGVFVPTLMFDLCHQLIKLEATSGKAKIPEDFLVFERRKNPGDLLPYKVFNIDTDVPQISSNGNSIDLRKIYGFKLSLSCKPERLQWVASSNSDAHYIIHLSIDQLKIGSDDCWSFLGPNQFFYIDGEGVVALPDLTGFCLINLARRKVEHERIKTMRAANAKINQSLPGDDNLIGEVDLTHCPLDISNKYSERIYLEAGLDDSIFEKLIISLKRGDIEAVNLEVNLSIDSVFTASDPYGGWSSDVVFYNNHDAVGTINNFSIEYRIKSI